MVDEIVDVDGNLISDWKPGFLKWLIEVGEEENDADGGVSQYDSVGVNWLEQVRIGCEWGGVIDVVNWASR